MCDIFFNPNVFEDKDFAPADTTDIPENAGVSFTFSSCVFAESQTHLNEVGKSISSA